MSKRSTRRSAPLDTLADEHPLANLSALHISLCGIYKPILLLESLLAHKAIGPDRLFAAHSELTRINTIYSAVLARMRREFGEETALIASQGIQEQLHLELAATDPRSLLHDYPVLRALL